MKLKKISPLSANRRAMAISSPVRLWVRDKADAIKRKPRWRVVNPRPPISDNQRVAQLAQRLLRHFREHGRWPNAHVRWWPKDPTFRRAMRLAKRSAKR